MSSVTPVRDPVAQPFVALMDVFGAHADTLRFPDVDHVMLEELAGQVREAATEVAQCEQALAHARRALDERQAVLRLRAERGMAYAKIYAEDDATLLAQLDEIDLSPRKTAAKRGSKHPPRRTRTRRTKPAVADETVKELPFEPNSTRAQASVA